MSAAPGYTPTTSFANDETNGVAGRSTVKTVSLDTECANIASSINALNTNLQIIQRDDGKLKDFAVEPYALSEQARSLIATGGTPRGMWAAATLYEVSDVVQYGTIAYMCYVQHTSTGVFDATKFIAISGDGQAATHAAQAATSDANAATSAATATTQATNAAASASSAATQASNAATSASNASTNAGIAQGHANNASTSATNAALSYDSFDDRYLGAKTADPTLDNDGNALLVGAIYWNSTSNVMKAWTSTGTWATLQVNSQPLNDTLSSISNASLGPFAHRNKIINGSFDIWQRGTSQTISGYGSADRWFNDNVGTTKTFSRQAFALGQIDVPGEPTYFSRTVVTTAAGAANYCKQLQAIESVRTLAGKSTTITFWAKADAAKNIAIEFVQIFGSGGTPSLALDAIGAQLIPLTTAWQKFTKTIVIPSIAGKTLGTAGDDYLGINFWFDAGTSFATRTASLGQQSGTFDIAQVQIEEGSVATPFEQRPIGYETSLCQRYFQVGSSNVVGFARTTTSITVNIPLATRMRSTPTITLLSTSPYSESPWFTTAVTPSGTAAIGGTHLSSTAAAVDVTGYAGLTVNTPSKIDGTNFTLSAEL